MKNYAIMIAAKTSVMGFLFSGLLAVAAFTGSAFAATPRALLNDNLPSVPAPAPAPAPFPSYLIEEDIYDFDLEEIDTVILPAVRRLTAANTNSGIATSYCSNPKKEKMPKCAVPNACGIKALSPSYVQYFAGVPKKLLGGNCGKCVQVTGAAGTVVAQVIDSFTDTGVTINLSQEALKKATGFASDRKPVSWKFVACAAPVPPSPKPSPPSPKPSPPSPKPTPSPPPSNVFSGIATSYCSNPKKEKMPKCAVPNDCDIKALSPAYVQYFAGVPQNKLGGNCGKCVLVTGAAGTVKAQVIDSFVTPGVSINLSQEALKKATGFASDKKPVTWKFVAC